MLGMLGMWQVLNVLLQNLTPSQKISCVLLPSLCPLAAGKEEEDHWPCGRRA